MSTPTPVWEQAIAHDGHVVLEASAGTGKTYALEHLVVSLVESGTPLERILIVTFTEKAARELRERVRRQLAERYRALEPSEDGGAPGEDSPAQRLKQALIGFDQATIATIHGFCQRVLTRYAFEGGRLLEQSLVDGRTLFREVLLDVLRERLADDGDEVSRWLQAALDVQGLDGLVGDLHAAHAQRGRLEPGSVELDAVRAVCGRVDEEATDEALERAPIKKPLARYVAECAAAFAEAASDDDPFAALGSFVAAEKKTFTREKQPVSVPELVRREVAPHVGGEPALRPVVDAFEVLAAHRTTREALLAHALLPGVRARLAETKAERGLFDFDDLLALVQETLACPDRGPGLVRALREEFRVALIDEFQDTDGVQWDIFRRVFFESPDGHKLVVVGDPKQAIYGFRGADVDTYLAAVRDIASSGGLVVPLDTCYRATGELVDGYNRIFAEDFFPEHGGISYDPVACGKPDLTLSEAGGAAAPALSVVRLTPAAAGGKMGRGALRAGWAEFVASEIRRLVDPAAGLRLADHAYEPPRPGGSGDDGRLTHADVHILTRTAREAQEIGRVLRRHRIPHAFYRQTGLFQTAEAADVAALLSALSNLHRPSERLRAWLTPFFGLEVADLVHARDLDEGHVLVRRLQLWRGLAEDQAWARLFDALVHESGLVRRLLFSQPGERELTNYLHLFEVLLAEAHAAPVILEELASRVEAWVAGRRRPEVGDEPDVQRLDTEKDAVQILTMHAAKGLEAPVVFLAGGWGAPPDSLVKVFHREGERVVWVGSAWGEAAEAVEAERAAEDRRLLYVALTRARGRLYLPHVEDGALRTRLKGAYATVRDRLGTILAEGPPPGWEVRTHACGVEEIDPPREEAQGPAVAVEVPEARPPALDLEGARRRAAPVLVTSYSRIKSGFERHRVAEGAELQQLRDDAEDRGLPELDGEALPGGKVVGVFLHQALEETDYAEVRASEGYLDWAGRPEVARRFRSLAHRHGVAPEHLPRAMALVHRALTVPVRAPGPDLPQGFCALPRVVPEMPFVYPIPERAHRLLGAPDGGEGGLPWRVERGFLQGVVDLVFEHDGRTWLLDWKSDRLPDYGPRALDAHVEAAYRDQARIYAIAVLRALGIRTETDHRDRFGGILYCFLRGFDGTGAGLWVQRPTWDEVVSWERWLLGRGAHEWGVPLDRVLGS